MHGRGHRAHAHILAISRSAICSHETRWHDGNSKINPLKIDWNRFVVQAGGFLVNCTHSEVNTTKWRCDRWNFFWISAALWLTEHRLSVWAPLRFGFWRRSDSGWRRLFVRRCNIETPRAEPVERLIQNVRALLIDTTIFLRNDMKSFGSAFEWSRFSLHRTLGMFVCLFSVFRNVWSRPNGQWKWLKWKM